MMRSRISTLVAAMVAGLVLAGTANAQARVQERVSFAVTGEITALDVGARSLTVKSTNDQGVVYSVADSATILSGTNTKLAIGDLKKGWAVVMNGQDDGVTKVATYVKVVKAPSP